MPEQLLRFVRSKWAALAAVIDTSAAGTRTEAAMLPAVVAQLRAVLPQGVRLEVRSTEDRSADAAAESAWWQQHKQRQRQPRSAGAVTADPVGTVAGVAAKAAEPVSATATPSGGRSHHDSASDTPIGNGSATVKDVEQAGHLYLFGCA